MNSKTKNRRVTPGRAVESWRLLRGISLLVSTTCAVGCGDMMVVGTGSSFSCQEANGCVSDSIELPADPGGTPASATTPLASTWTRAAPGALMVRSSDNGLWLASTREASMVLVHLSEQGDPSGETVIEGPPPAKKTRVLGDMRALTEHASGPVATVEWSFFSLTGEPCNDHYTAYGDPRGVQCEDKLAESLLFDGTQLSSPTRLKTCATKEHSYYCYPTTAIRSRDGQSLLTATFEHAHVQTLSGQMSSMDLPSGVASLSGTATEGASFLLYTSDGSHFGYGRRDLVTVTPGAVSRVATLEGADVSAQESGAGFVFAGPRPGQTIVVFEAGPPASGPTQPLQGRRDIPAAQVPRDVKVLRMEGSAVASQQTLARQSFSELKLETAGVDDAGNVYITTATGDRAAVVANALTPLLCRLPVTGEGACVQVPVRATNIQVSHSGVVYARAGDDISRFDFPR